MSRPQAGSRGQEWDTLSAWSTNLFPRVTCRFRGISQIPMQAGLGDSGRAGAVCPRICEQYYMHVNQYTHVRQHVVR